MATDARPRAPARVNDLWRAAGAARLEASQRMFVFPKQRAFLRCDETLRGSAPPFATLRDALERVRGGVRG